MVLKSESAQMDGQWNTLALTCLNRQIFRGSEPQGQGGGRTQLPMDPASERMISTDACLTCTRRRGICCTRPSPGAGSRGVVGAPCPRGTGVVPRDHRRGRSATSSDEGRGEDRDHRRGRSATSSNRGRGEDRARDDHQPALSMRGRRNSEIDVNTQPI